MVFILFITFFIFPAIILTKEILDDDNRFQEICKFKSIIRVTKRLKHCCIELFVNLVHANSQGWQKSFLLKTPYKQES